MIDCIFTIDYEIYGNGDGSLKDLVYEPAEQLRNLFLKWDARFVTFAEVAEFERIEERRTDAAIDDVRRQLHRFHREGFEIALHLHPQWYNAEYRGGRWVLDYAEYNLCVLPRDRIRRIVDRSIDYLRDVLGEPAFIPLAFRAGNWLFQPTQAAADVLAKKGIKIDSSVFKGGLQRNHGLDYRAALRNGYYWRFQSDANKEEPEGPLLEIPTYTRMVPFWRMITGKRVALQRKSIAAAKSNESKLKRYLDYLRPWYPLKFDFCRMTAGEMISMFDRIIREDRADPETYRPIVAIGHTKDLVDFDGIAKFLSYLKERAIRIATFEEVYEKCVPSARAGAV